jgi:hypothetical protein
MSFLNDFAHFPNTNWETLRWLKNEDDLNAASICRCSFLKTLLTLLDILEA